MAHVLLAAAAAGAADVGCVELAVQGNCASNPDVMLSQCPGVCEEHSR